MARTGIRLAGAALIALAAALIAPPAHRAAAGERLVVDGGAADCPGAGFTSLQAAVDAARSGDTIQVCAGTYTEQVQISGFDSLTLIGSGGPVISPPAGASGALVRVADSRKVKFEGFTLDGAGAFSDGVCHPAPGDAIAGLVYERAGGIIRGNTITGIHAAAPAQQGCPEGDAIRVVNDGPQAVTVQIRSNQIADFQQTGVAVQGAVALVLRYNTISGWGPTGLIAQTGVRVAGPVSGRVKDNAISGLWYSPAAPDGGFAAGIRAVDASGLRLQGNAISGAQTGIVVEARCAAGGAPEGASGNKIKGNTISGAQMGIVVTARDGADSLCDPAADGNLIVSNTLAGGPGAAAGIRLAAYPDADGPTPFSPRVQATGVRANTIQGFPEPIHDGGTDTQIGDNTVLP